MTMFIWLIIALIAFIVEMATPSALVSIWFAVGAVVAALFSNVIQNDVIEIFIFVVVSGLSFIAFRPLIMKMVKVKAENTNADRLIGYKGRLSEAITKEKWGALEISGLRYSISSQNNEIIDVNQWVKVVGLKGARLIVEKTEEGEA